jgi:hypothetical protein
MGKVDDWYDWWRLVNALICGAGVVLLLLRYHNNHHNYNTKTLDIWYAFVAWTLTGLISSLEGIIRNSELGLRVLCVSVGGLVTLKALLRKGSWGNQDA